MIPSRRRACRRAIQTSMRPLPIRSKQRKFSSIVRLSTESSSYDRFLSSMLGHHSPTHASLEGTLPVTLRPLAARFLRKKKAGAIWPAFSLLAADFWRISANSGASMPCSEYIRLHQLYEVALRQWGIVMLPPDNERVGALVRRTDEIKQKAFDERDTAKKQLGRHNLTCPVCNSKLKFIRPAK